MSVPFPCILMRLLLSQISSPHGEGLLAEILHQGYMYPLKPSRPWESLPPFWVIWIYSHQQYGGKASLISQQLTNYPPFGGPSTPKTTKATKATTLRTSQGGMNVDCGMDVSLLFCAAAAAAAADDDDDDDDDDMTSLRLRLYHMCYSFCKWLQVDVIDLLSPLLPFYWAAEDPSWHRPYRCTWHAFIQECQNESRKNW